MLELGVPVTQDATIASEPDALLRN